MVKPNRVVTPAETPLDIQSDGRMLTISQASDLLNAHPNSLRRWADIGLLPVYRIGLRGDRRFRATDVAAFLVSGQRYQRKTTSPTS